jgi:MOSC domain-containing protein YiiM
MDQPCVISVSAHPEHAFSKPNLAQISLLTGLGVAGDAHCGKTVKHRSRVAQNPDQPNLRQVHLIHSELFDELSEKGFQVQPGELGENVTTRGIDLLSLPVGTKLKIGAEVIVELTGLRNPCGQIENFQKGLLNAVLDRDANGNLIRKAGVMGIVLKGGEARPGDAVSVELPPPPHKPLERV